MDPREIKKTIERGVKPHRLKPVRISGKEYGLYVFSEDEDINLFEGFLFAEPENKSELTYLESRYRPPVSGYVPRLSFLLFQNQLVIKDHLRNKKLRKTSERVNKGFLAKLKKALGTPNEANLRKLFDRTDIIEEFYILYKKSRDFLLNNIKGISDEDRRTEFVDNFMMQMLTLWYLQEKRFFNNDTRYFITKFDEEVEQKKLSGGFESYYEFLSYFFERVGDLVDEQYYEDEKVGKVVVVGPAIFINGEMDSKAITIPDKCFYKKGVTKTLIDTQPKKVGADVPLFNLFESRDWTEGNIDEYVLGAIYEKLITYMERKKLGAYYTPEEITSYICENTIEPYLLDRVNERFGERFETIDQAVGSEDREILHYLFKQLNEITILDPAVGSAHFLESAINVLVDVYEQIWEKAKEIGLRDGLEIVAADEKGNIKKINLLDITDLEQFRIYIKFFIILSKNIYGVDINSSAIKVAKARLFLTLAKHFDAGKGYFIRFPNVHFNLRHGNSLVGYTRIGEEGKMGQLTLSLFVKEGEAAYVMEMVKLPDDLKGYLPHAAASLGIEGDIKEEIAGLNEILSKREIGWDDFKKVLKTKEKLITVLIASLNSQHARPLNALINRITGLFNTRLDEKFAEEHGMALGDIKTIRTFHWVFEFPEVLLEKDGFDVVIGNPPYVRADVEDERLLLQRTIVEGLKEYETLFEKWDLFVSFIERSIRDLLNGNGKFSFIVSDALCTVKYGGKVRKWLAGSFHIPSIDYFEGFQVFVGVGIVPIVFFVDKSRPPAKTMKIIHTDSFDNISSKTQVSQDSPSLFKKAKIDILDFNFGKVIRLGDICFISKGIVPHSDEKIAKGEFKKEDLISEIKTGIHVKKYVEGKNISRYQIKEIRYLEWGTERVPLKISRPTFEKLYVGKKILRGKIKDGVIDIQDITTNDSILIFKRFIDLKGIDNRSIRNSVKKNCNLPRAKLEKISANFDYEYLLAIINSTFANRYLNAIRTHRLKNFFNPDDFRELPIKKLKNLDVFKCLTNYLQFLYTEDSPEAEFFDRQILDYLVYELYFSEKFEEDGLDVNLAEKVQKHLEPIEYDRWAVLAFREGLTEEKAREKENLGRKNLDIVEKVYRRLKDDDGVMRDIEQIKSHPWVKAVEDR